MKLLNMTKLSLISWAFILAYSALLLIMSAHFLFFKYEGLQIAEMNHAIRNILSGAQEHSSHGHILNDDERYELEGFIFGNWYLSNQLSLLNIINALLLGIVSVRKLIGCRAKKST